MDKGSVGNVCQSVAPINYIVYEAEQCRNERREKRTHCIYCGIIVGLMAIIMALVWFISQYDYVSYTQDGMGVNNICTSIGGDINNGAESENPNQE